MKMLFENVLRLIALFVTLYMLLLLFAYLSQQQLLYFPTQNRPTEQLAATLQLQHWPANGHGYRGLMAHPRQSPRGTIIIFHGNAGTAWERRFYIAPLVAAGYRVVLAEYPGYAGRPGPLNEQALVADAVEIVATARHQFSGPVILWGESLGAAVAAAVTAKNPAGIAAVVLITPWDSLPALAQKLYWYLPARWLTRDQYANRRNLKDYTGRVAVLLAERDEIIPSQESTRLYDSLSTTKRLWVFAGADHNGWPTSPHASWWHEVIHFIAAPD